MCRSGVRERPNFVECRAESVPCDSRPDLRRRGAQGRSRRAGGPREGGLRGARGPVGPQSVSRLSVLHPGVLASAVKRGRQFPDDRSRHQGRQGAQPAFFEDRFEMASDAEQRYLAATADLGEALARDLRRPAGGLQELREHVGAGRESATQGSRPRAVDSSTFPERFSGCLRRIGRRTRWPGSGTRRGEELLCPALFARADRTHRVTSCRSSGPYPPSAQDQKLPSRPCGKACRCGARNRGCPRHNSRQSCRDTRLLLWPPT